MQPGGSRSLGKLTQRGVINPDNPVFAGGWTITFQRADTPRIPFEIWHAAIKGPANSTFQVYLDDVFFGNVVRGDINDLDPFQPILVDNDTNVYFHWSTGSGSAPVATAFFRQQIY